MSNYGLAHGIPVKFLVIVPYVKGGTWVGHEAERETVNTSIKSNLVSTDCSGWLADADGWLKPEYAADKVVHESDAGEQQLANCIAVSTGE